MVCQTFWLGKGSDNQHDEDYDFVSKWWRWLFRFNM